MAERTDETTGDDATLDPTESTGRGASISAITWVMVLVFLVIIAFGALMISGLLGPGMRNEVPASNSAPTR